MLGKRLCLFFCLVALSRICPASQYESVKAALESGLQLEAVDWPEALEAGSCFEATVLANKDFNLSNMGVILISGAGITLKTHGPYLKSVAAVVEPSMEEFLLGDKQEEVFRVRGLIGPYLAGNFQSYFAIWLYDKEGAVFVRKSLGRTSLITSIEAHMTPPILLSLNLDRGTYRVGDVATARFTTASPLPENYQTSHIEWVSADPSSRESLPEFEDGVFRRVQTHNDGSYSISFKILRGVKAGVYFLKYFNRLDQYDNFASTVGEFGHEESEVIQATPLVVEENGAP